MAYTTKNFVGEIAGLIILRLLCIGACICFALPMFNTNIIQNYTLTGFGSIFGIPESTIHGNTLALVAFVLPIGILIITLFDFMGDHRYTAVFISGILSAIFTIVYFANEFVRLNGENFGFKDIETGFSWGCYVLLGIYLAIIIIGIICRKIA